MNNYSETATSIFQHMQEGRQRAWAISIQEGSPAIMKCGNVFGNVLALAGKFSADGKTLSLPDGSVQKGSDLFILMDQKKRTNARFSIIIGGEEVINSNGADAEGFFSAVAQNGRNPERSVGLVATWNAKEGVASWIEASSDEDFVALAHALTEVTSIYEEL